MSRRRASLWIPPIVYMGLIFTVSSMSEPAPQVTRLIWDKAIHFVEYGVLGVLLYRALNGESFSRRHSLLLAMILASAYAATDEWHQAFVPPRASSVMDWIADTLGAAAGALALSLADRD